jgi:hypothetical protein
VHVPATFCPFAAFAVAEAEVKARAEAEARAQAEAKGRAEAEKAKARRFKRLWGVQLLCCRSLGRVSALGASCCHTLLIRWRGRVLLDC